MEEGLHNSLAKVWLALTPGGSSLGDLHSRYYVTMMSTGSATDHHFFGFFLEEVETSLVGPVLYIVFISMADFGLYPFV